MTRRYTGAEALALKAAATAGPLTVCAFPPGASYPHATTVQAPDGDVAWCELFAHAANAALFAASHDLATSLAAVEAERDEAVAQLRADDSPSRRPCGDNSCVLREPGPHGMGTNGGCRCPAGLMRSRYRVLRAERDALRVLARAVLEAEHLRGGDGLTKALAALREAVSE